MSELADRAAVEGLFADTDEGPRLLGSRCASCQTPYFPRSEICHNPNCEATRMQDAQFGPHGRLFSCAIQNYPPPSPALYDEPYEPYAVGIVDLREGLRVLGRLRCGEPESLAPGIEVELVIAPLATTEAGERVVSWQFEPRAEEGA